MLLQLLFLATSATLIAAGPDDIDAQGNTVDTSATRSKDRGLEGLEGILGSLAGGVAGAALQGGGVNVTALLQSSGLASALLPILGSTLGGLIANKLAEGEKYAAHYGDKHDGDDDGVLATWGGIGADGRPSVGGIVARHGARPSAKQATVLLPPAYVLSFSKRPGLYAAGIMSGYRRPTTSAPPPATTTVEPANRLPVVLEGLDDYFSTLTMTPPEETVTESTDDEWYSTAEFMHSTSTAPKVTKPKAEKSSTTPSTTTTTKKTTTTTTPKPKPSTQPQTLKPKTTTTTTTLKPTSSPLPTPNYHHESTATTTTTAKQTRPPRPTHNYQHASTTTTTLKPTWPTQPDHTYQHESQASPRPEYNNQHESTMSTTPKPTWHPRPEHSYEPTVTTIVKPTLPPRPDHNYYYESTTTRPYPHYYETHRSPVHQTGPTESTTQIPYDEEYEDHDQGGDDDYRYPVDEGEYYRDPAGRPYHHYSPSEEEVADTAETVYTGDFAKRKHLERSHPPSQQSRHHAHDSASISTTKWPYHIARKPQWAREPLPSGSRWPPTPGRFLEDVYPEKE